MLVRSAADLGALIRAYRLHAGWSQDMLALKVGTSQKTISAIELGKETAQLGRVLRCCAVLGIELSAPLPDASGASAPSEGGTFDLPDGIDIDDISDAGTRP